MPTMSARPLNLRLPCLIAEHDDRFPPGCARIFRKQRTTQHRVDTKHLKVITSDQLSLEGMTFYPCVQTLNRGDIRKRRFLFRQFLILVPRESMFVFPAVRPSEAVQAIGIVYRKRAQHVSIEQREQGQVQAETECDGA